MKVIITVGISGSGKSTFARSMGKAYSPESPYITICRDDTRWNISGKRGWNGPNAYMMDKQIEGHVTAINNDQMVMCALAGKDVIIADTNLNPKFREEIINYFLSMSYEMEIKEFPISFQEALSRDAQRGIYAVGEKVLAKQWEQWVKYHEDKQQGAW